MLTSNPSYGFRAEELLGEVTATQETKAVMMILRAVQLKLSIKYARKDERNQCRFVVLGTSFISHSSDDNERSSDDNELFQTLVPEREECRCSDCVSRRHQLDLEPILIQLFLSFSLMKKCKYSSEMIKRQ